MNNKDMKTGGQEKKKTAKKTASQEMYIDEKALKKIVGGAMLGIPGLLGPDGGFGDFLRSNSDLTRGVEVDTDDDEGTVTVTVKIITETGKNMPAIVQQAEKEIRTEVEETTGIKVTEVNVEISDTMTAKEFEDEYGVMPKK